MTFRTQLTLILLTSCTLLLTGCTLFNLNPGPRSFTSTQACENLKQRINDNDYRYSIPGQYGNSPTVAAQLYKEYAHYNCPQLIEGKDKSPLPASYTEDKDVIKSS